MRSRRRSPTSWPTARPPTCRVGISRGWTDVQPRNALRGVTRVLEVVDLRTARLRIEIFDVAAVIYLLRKVVWWVPGFTVDGYRRRLRELHEQIQREGPFVAHSTRHLIEARRR